MSSDDSRAHGIEFGSLPEKLESIDYPSTGETIREEFGDFELDLQSGSTTVDEALAELDDQEFEGPDDVLFAIKNGIGSEAVGREGYTDRAAGEPETPSDESL